MEKEDQKLLEVAICGYLPYGMKCNLMGMCKDDDSEMPKPLIYTITGINKSEQEIMIEGESEYYYQDVFPLLYPIECLTKPITVEGYSDGKEFIPIEEMCKEFYFHKSKTDYKITKTHTYISCESRNGESIYVMKDYNKIDYWIIEYLNQWHIDWRGLIAKGLAVDKTSTL